MFYQLIHQGRMLVKMELLNDSSLPGNCGTSDGDTNIRYERNEQ
jgi:hypothetical protein